MSERAQIIVLCEDLQTQVFIRRALMRWGIRRHKMRFEALPPSGAGDAYVLKNYPSQVKAFRIQNARCSYGLVVHVDADPGSSTSDRHSQLAQRLKEETLPPRQPGEPISELVPKRNIETWIYALDSRLLADLPLDEDTEYPKLCKCQRECATAAEAFADLANAGSPPPVVVRVPSLGDGLAEFARLPK